MIKVQRSGGSNIYLACLRSSLNFKEKKEDFALDKTFLSETERRGNLSLEFLVMEHLGGSVC